MFNRTGKIVSIIMPVYNAAGFLEDSVGDILNQTFKGFELICVDDGSSDGSGAILDEYAEKDDRIRVVHQENRGGGIARNAGMREADGKYLLFLDADDRFEPDLLKVILDEAEKTNCDVLTFGADTFNHLTGEKGKASWLIKNGRNEIKENPFDSVNTTVWNKLFRKDYIDRIGIQFQSNRIVDTMCFVAIALLGMGKGIVVHDILLHYRTNNENSIIANADKYPLEIYLALKEIYREIEKRDYLKSSLPYYYDFAMENLRIRLDMLNDSSAFHELYTCLHEGGLDDIGLTSNVEGLGRHRDWDFVQLIRKYDAEEYLFYRLKYLRNRGFTDMTVFDISDDMMRTCIDKVVWVHGGGMVGKCYVRRLMKESVTMSCWSDGSKNNAAYPITSIQDAMTKSFDVVLLAVESEKTAAAMRADLVNAGVDDEKIYWERPIRI